jgi:hypothetical protein
VSLNPYPDGCTDADIDAAFGPDCECDDPDCAGDCGPEPDYAAIVEADNERRISDAEWRDSFL